jgi:hypothetical protein
MRSVLAVIFAAACGQGGSPGGDAGSTDGRDLFERELVEIRIDMEPALWDQLRHQQKTRHSAFGREDCRNQLIPNPYTWFEATVTIDGEELAGTGVRKKGHIGSQSTLIPSLKLRFDEFVVDQTFHGLDRVSLNNSKSDPSYARTCLAYRVFAAAGLPASRCTFGHLVVNGDDLGPYVLVEEVSKPYLARHFESDEGNLYEGTANDFRPDAVGGFEQETNKTDTSRADIQAVMDALEAGDAELVERLGAVVNLDQFFRFWAAESLVWHRDGYSGHSNNFFIYADPGDGGRFAFLPWGPDGTFQVDNREEVPDSVLAFGVIANRLYAIPGQRQRYYDELGKLLDNDWAPAALVEAAEQASALVRPLLPDQARADHDADSAELIDFVRGRREAVEAIMAGALPDWTEGLRDLPCRPPAGPIAGTFTTTWGTLEEPPVATGSATVDVELGGEVVLPSDDGARAGPTQGSLDRVWLQFVLPGNRALIVRADLPVNRWFERYTSPGDHPLLSPPVSMIAVEQDMSVSPPLVLQRFEVGEGTWTFDEIATTPGAAVSGSFSGMLFVAP